MSCRRAELIEITMINQHPEQIARDQIDGMLESAGWVVQSKKGANLSAGKGVAIKEYQTDVGPADYVLFVGGRPVGVIEAKREEEGVRITEHEMQAEEYASATLKYHLNESPLPFVYQSTGVLTRFTDRRDPNPRSREVFCFHRPETLSEWSGQPKTLRANLQAMPELDETGLRPAQIKAIGNLETSLKNNKPRALIQMTMGAGKTFTACTFAYRLLKHADARRILFLVDTKNLGEQAEQEFLKFQPTDDNRKFSELYNVQRLSHNHISPDSHVCISTIQRLYSILKGRALDESAEQENPNETQWKANEPSPVEYSADNPVEQFDFIVIDECHRSIYNLWRQVLEYYDAFLIGLTATPDNRTFAFFNANVVSEYTFEESITDGVNVPYDVFTIETEISQSGATIEAEEYIEQREKLTRKKRWERLDEDLEYTPGQLDKDVVNPGQIRNIIKACKESLRTKIFPDRFDENGEFETPKTLVFAKTDSHADDIIQTIREEFDEGNDFCKKITYKTDEDPKSVLNRFRNSYNPRIAVTVDMVATGTDVRPLEVLLFMRDVKSASYFEQMIGRGNRTISFDDLRQVTRTAKHVKDRFVIVDAVGVTKSRKTDSRPLERKPGVPLKDLLGAVTMGVQDEDLFTSLANRLIRLEKQMSEEEKGAFEGKAGKRINQAAKDLLNAYDPDIIEGMRLQVQKENTGESPDLIEENTRKEMEKMRSQAAATFTGEMNEYIENVRRIHEQVIDSINRDTLRKAEWDSFTEEKALDVVRNFSEYLQDNKDEITALSFFFGQPHRRKDLTYRMVEELTEKLKRERPLLAPVPVWEAYKRLGKTKSNSPKSELVALVSLIRAVAGLDAELTPYDEKVDKNFQRWVFDKQSGALKFNQEQMDWLRMLKEHVAGSFHIEREDLSYAPFDSLGGIGKMQRIFGDRMDEIIDEMNEALVA